MRTTDYSETSQVVHFLTRDCGVVKLIAKGSKRPKSKTGGAIDLLGEGDLVFSLRSGQDLGTLMEFTETTAHTPLRKDSARLNTALYLIELAGTMLAETDPHPEVFDLLHNALDRLGQADAPIAAVLAYYQWRLLRNVGLLGDMSACVSCVLHISPADPSAEHGLCFSSRQGGLLCDACHGDAPEKFQVDEAALAGIMAIAAAEAGRKVSLPENQARAVSRMLAYHIREQLGHRLKMERHAIGDGGRQTDRE